MNAVAVMAAGFTERLGARAWGEVLGRWHDIGKYAVEFQDFLLRANGFEAHLEAQTKVDHSTAGAQHAFQHMPKPVGKILAYCIAGHHAGLADDQAPTGRSGLRDRLKKTICNYQSAPKSILVGDPPDQPPLEFDDLTNARQTAFQLAFFTRMLFSCLVDADFLATEQFMNSTQAKLRVAAGPSIQDLATQLDQYLDDLRQKAEPSFVNDRRQEVLAACRSAAAREPGFFSLTVPTGGGKTLASLAFALGHAETHGLDRVIYAIPFTSIIEQTADVFRGVFETLGEQAVLEHHSNLDPNADRETPWTRLAAENWDSRLVVTTNVQLFESLFANRTSRCRKLHRIARSVIVLDEAQTLPVELLNPCLVALRELVRNYRCTIVFCTATQPALARNDDFRIGIEADKLREIIPQPQELYRQMKRVEVSHLGPLTDEELIARLSEHESFLCIANTRAHAAELFESLRKHSSQSNGLYHLSTWMCGAHRAEVIKQIRTRLAKKQRCRVISTQLIEAGVDVDFPVVYRAMTGIDSIAQAAGRCNREGKLDHGSVFVFESAGRPKLRGLLGSTAETTRELLPDVEDLLALETVEQYFRLHYWKRGHRDWDDKAVLDQFIEPFQAIFQFKEAAKRFQMIEDESQPVIVPYGKRGRWLIERLASNKPLGLKMRRRLQRYTVSVFENIFRNLFATQQLEIRHDCYAVLLNEDLYDEQLGLRTEVNAHEPESLII
ncbi:CRISPR-associated helicase Cas3' [Thalassoroseus pseudoceratinae]|uniref:CRISPR-associated helicase Cas3' n=1 Tax=Thalassoroseus pseudoceratinae TaxID=2713176 RepID=UPI00141FE80C|nr:CRISPR-associated helicase Cas3' [Thalassoroseus pseudoceratinae]